MSLLRDLRFFVVRKLAIVFNLGFPDNLVFLIRNFIAAKCSRESLLFRPAESSYQPDYQRIAEPGNFPEDRSDKGAWKGNAGGDRLCQDTISQSIGILLGNFG